MMPIRWLPKVEYRGYRIQPFSGTRRCGKKYYIVYEANADEKINGGQFDSLKAAEKFVDQYIKRRNRKNAHTD